MTGWAGFPMMTLLNGPVQLAGRPMTTWVMTGEVDPVKEAEPA